MWIFHLRGFLSAYCLHLSNVVLPSTLYSLWLPDIADNIACVKRKTKQSRKSQRVFLWENRKTRTGKRGCENEQCAEWKLCLCSVISVSVVSQAPLPPYTLAKLMWEPSSALSLQMCSLKNREDFMKQIFKITGKDWEKLMFGIIGTKQFNIYLLFYFLYFFVFGDSVECHVHHQRRLLLCILIKKKNKTKPLFLQFWYFATRWWWYILIKEYGLLGIGIHLYIH